MTTLGPNFRRLFTAAILQELTFGLMVHFPGFLSHVGATEATIGLLYGSSAALALALRPSYGRILDVSHRKTVLLVSGAANTIVLGLLAFTGGFNALLWSLFLAHRVLQVALYTAMLTYAADSIPVATRTRGLALYGLSGLVSVALGGVAGDIIIDLTGFRGLFFSVALSSLASWALVWRLPLLPVMGRRPRRGFWSALLQRDLVPLWLFVFVFAVGVQTVFTFARTFIDDRGVGSAGVFFGVYGISAAAIRILGRGLYDRLPHRSSLVASSAVQAVGLGVLAVAHSASVISIAAALCGLALGAAFPIFSSQVVVRSRTAERGSALAIFTAFFEVALLAGVPLIGDFIERRGYTYAFLMVGVALMLGTLGCQLWDRQTKPAET